MLASALCCSFLLAQPLPAQSPPDLEGGPTALWTVTTDTQVSIEDRVRTAVATNGLHVLAVDRRGGGGWVPALIAVDAGGAVVWQQDFPGNDDVEDEAVGLSHDPVSGDLFLLVHRKPDPVGGAPNRKELIRASVVDGTPLWTQTLEAAGEPILEPVAVAYDPVGDRVVTLSQIGTTTSAGTDSLTVAFDATSGAVLWQARFDGAQTDDPRALSLASDGSLAFVLDNRGGGGTFTRGALRAQTLDAGTPVWSVDDLGLGVEVRLSTPSQASGLAVAGTFGGPSRIVRALDPATGNQLWTTPVPTPFAWRITHSPDGARIFFTGAQGLTPLGVDVTTYGIDATTGAVTWIQTLPGGATSVFSGPRGIVVSPDGTRVAVGGAAGSSGTDDLVTVLYDAATGAELWQATSDAITTVEPTDRGPLVFSANGARVLAAGTGVGAVDSNDATSIGYDSVSGSEQYLTQVDSTDSGFDAESVLAVDPLGQRVLVSSTVRGPNGDQQAQVVARDPGTGSVLWSRSLGPTQLSSPPPTVRIDGAAARVYLLYRDLEGAALLTLDASDGAVLWERSFTGRRILDEEPMPLALSPAGDRLYLALNKPNAGPFSPTDLEVVAVDATTGQDLWSDLFDGGLQDEAEVVGLSPDGSAVVVVAEKTTSTLFPLPAGVDVRLLTRTYDSQLGTLLWSDEFDSFPASGTNNDFANDLAFSPDGARLFVVGSSEPNGASFTDQSVAICYDMASGARLWSKVKYDGNDPGESGFRKVRTTADGALVLVAGFKRDSSTLQDQLALALDPSSGAVRWETRIDEGLNEFLRDATFDATGALLVLAGVSTSGSPLAPTDFGSGLLTALETATGTPVWRSRDVTGAPNALELSVAWDAVGRRLFVGTQELIPGASADQRLDAIEEPLLVGLGGEIPVGAGGVQSLAIRPGQAFAGDLYVLLGSASGTAPDVPFGGFELPLVFDAYTNLTLSAPNQPPLASSFAAIDGNGAALAAFTLPSSSSSALAGITLHHAYVVIDLSSGFPSVSEVSNPLPLALVP